MIVRRGILLSFKYVLLTEMLHISNTDASVWLLQDIKSPAIHGHTKILLV
jgi:hypothetical protein